MALVSVIWRLTIHSELYGLTRASCVPAARSKAQLARAANNLQPFVWPLVMAAFAKSGRGFGFPSVFFPFAESVGLTGLAPLGKSLQRGAPR
jgi:hypothetical protein